MKNQNHFPKNPLVSVIIPCYNHGKYLLEAVNSVFESTYQHFEIIIIDDGSTDGSFQVAQELALQYPTLIQSYTQENSGPSVARNKAIAIAKGKYILPLDADDKIGCNYLEQGIYFLEKDPDIKLVYCEAEKFGLKSGHWKLGPFCRQSLAQDNMIFVTSLFRKSDWEAVGGFDERMKWGWEDWEFWISLLKNGGQVKKLPILGFYYRIHSISRRKSVTKQDKQRTIALLNKKHTAFLTQQLGGPIRNPRSWSKAINKGLTYFSFFTKYSLSESIHSHIFDKR